MRIRRIQKIEIDKRRKRETSKKLTFPDAKAEKNSLAGDTREANGFDDRDRTARERLVSRTALL